MQPAIAQRAAIVTTDHDLPTLDMVGLRQGLGVLVSDEAPSLAERPEDEVQPRHDEHAEDGAEEHSPERRRADGAVAYGAWPRGHEQRKQAGDEGERRHQDRTE